MKGLEVSGIALGCVGGSGRCSCCPVVGDVGGRGCSRSSVVRLVGCGDCGVWGCVVRESVVECGRGMCVLDVLGVLACWWLALEELWCVPSLFPWGVV